MTTLTGLSHDQLVKSGRPLAAVLAELSDFVGLLPVIGYNLRFDEAFLLNALQRVGQARWPNKMIDVKPNVMKAEPFLDNFKLSTVLKQYGGVNEQPHQALSDARATLRLADKLIEGGALKL